MKVISDTTHGILDYVTVAIFVLAPAVLGLQHQRRRPGAGQELVQWLRRRRGTKTEDQVRRVGVRPLGISQQGVRKCSCPWCEQPITHDRFEEIQAKLKAEEREKTAALERKRNFVPGLCRRTWQSRSKTRAGPEAKSRPAACARNPRR